MSVFKVRHQGAAQRVLQRGLASARTPHAYIFHGPEGVGKEMLALRFAKLLLCEWRQGAEGPAAVREATDDSRGRLSYTACEAPDDTGDSRGPACSGSYMAGMAVPRTQGNPGPSAVPPEYASLPIIWQDSCGKCRSCTLLASGTHPDCHIIHRRLIKIHPDPEVRLRKALELGIPVIRLFVIEAAGKKPALGTGKVFILKGCDRLNEPAQNALLKTLEEPPPGTYLILLWPGLAHMLDTTRSRCQLVSFRPLPTAFVAEQLRLLRPGLPEEQVQYFSRHEPGSLGMALRLIDEGFYECNTQLVKQLVDLKRTDSVRLAENIQKMGEAQAKAVQQQFADSGANDAVAGLSADTTLDDELDTEEREDFTDKAAARQAMQSVLAMMATVYRDVQNLIVGRLPAVCNTTSADQLRRLASRFSSDQVRQAVRAIADAEYHLTLNANTRLCLEEMTIQLARLGGTG